MIAIEVHRLRFGPNLSPLRGLNLYILPWSRGLRPGLIFVAPAGLIRTADTRGSGQPWNLRTSN